MTPKLGSFPTEDLTPVLVSRIHSSIWSHTCLNCVTVGTIHTDTFLFINVYSFLTKCTSSLDVTCIRVLTYNFRDFSMPSVTYGILLDASPPLIRFAKTQTFPRNLLLIKGVFIYVIQFSSGARGGAAG